MIKCNVCGEQVELRKENRYDVLIEASVLQKSFGVKDRLYEAFDCPKCGCQMLMHERFPAMGEVIATNEEIKVTEGCIEENGTQKKEVGSRLPYGGCDAIETEWKDDEDDEDKIETTYGSENRKASDVTSDYLSKMTIDDLRAFGEENGIHLFGKHSRYYYIEQIRKHIFAPKEDEKEE